MELILQVFNVTAPVLLCSLAGYLWCRRDLPFDNAMVTPLLMYLAVPCLLLSSFSELHMPPDTVLRLLLATAVAHLLFGILGWVFLRIAGLDTGTYLSSLIFCNNGNLGLPLCMLAFGKQGLYMGLGYMLVSTIGLFTVGAWINSGRLKPGVLFKTPPLYAAVIALALAFSGVRLPTALLETFDILGDLAIPLMLLALGAALARLKITNLRASLLLTAFKGGMGLAVGVGLAWLFGLNGVTRSVFILQSLMPVAVFNYLLAEHHGRDGSDVAGFIVTSSLFGLVVIPLALAVLL